MISLKTVTAGLVVPVLALYASVGASAQSAVTLPFEADFEVEEGYSIGPISSDPAWKFGPTLDASIITPGANTSQALQIVGADWLWLLTDSQGAQVSWVDFYTKPVFVEPLKLPEVVESAQSAVTGFVKVDAQGEVFAIDGDGSGSGTWTGSGFLTALDADGESAFDWIRLTYRIDYFAKTWDLFIDGQLSLLDLGFLDDSRSSLEEFSMFPDMDAATYLDYFYAGNSSPLFTDSSGDGLSDDWLIAHGLDPHVYQRYADPDFDGLSNVGEFRLGTSPTLADTSGDGLDDGLKVLLDLDPLGVTSDPFGTLPFADGFESDAPGPFVSGTRLWTLDGGGSITDIDSPEGTRHLIASGESLTLARLFGDTADHASVWIDFQLKADFRTDTSTPEITAPRAASAFYFGPATKRGHFVKINLRGAEATKRGHFVKINLRGADVSPRQQKGVIS